MVIDFHTHVFPDDLAPQALATLRQKMPGVEAYTDGTESGLLRAMAAAGVTAAVTLPVATKPSQVATINSLAASQTQWPLVRFGALHPACDDIEGQIMFLRSHGIRGVKLHPEYQDFYVDDPRCFPMYEQLAQAGLIVVLHAGWDPGPFTCDHARPEAIRRIVERFPTLRLVAAHMGGNKMWDEVESALAGASLWLDTSVACMELEPDRLAHLARRHGVDRVLFGSDSPWFDLSRVVERIEAVPFTPEERERILWRNAGELLGVGRVRGLRVPGDGAGSDATVNGKISGAKLY